MKRVKNVIFLMVFLFITMFTFSCTTVENVNREKPEYTVTFKSTEGEVITQVTNFVGVEFRKFQIPSVPELLGYEGKWVDENGVDADFTGINSDRTFYTEYELCKYLVVFYDTENNIIPDSENFTNNQMVLHGHSAVAPELELEGYNLSWDKEFDNVTGPLEVHLVKKLKSYIVKFINEDNTLLSEQSVFYGYEATEPEQPTKAADVQYTYTFAGWDKDGDGIADNEPLVITCDTEFVAVYTSTLNKYRVIFENEDGTVLQNRLFEYGRVPVIPEQPTKDADVQYTYTFAGWDKDGDGIVDEIEAVTGDTTYTAVYSKVVNEYLVKFVDFDNTLLSEQYVAYGSAAVAPTGLLRTGYTFAGWDVDYSNIVGELTVKAVYTINQYTYKFVDEDGTTVLKEETVDYQATIVAPANPTKASDVQYDYAFAGWDIEFDTMPANDVVIKATYEAKLRKYEVVYKNEDGTVISSKEEYYGTIPTIPAEQPTKAADVQYTYTFAGWDKDGDGIADEIEAVTGDTTYTAVYSKVVNEYLVKFVDFDNTLLSEQYVAYGSAAVAPTGLLRTGYTFAGWDVDYSNIVGELTVKAVYTINQYTYKFVDEDGTTVLKEETVDYQATIVAPANPTKASDVQYDYVFAGWDIEFDTMPANDVVIKATYEAKLRKYEVVYKNEDGTVISSKEEYYGTIATLPVELPTKLGYSLIGWYVNGVEEVVSEFEITGPMEAIAVFQINRYTVIGRIVFDLGDGNITYLDREVVSGYYGETGLDIEAAIKSISWEREGYTLVGWKLADGTEVSLSDLTNFTMPAENTYLYPQYEAGKYIVRFYDDDNTLISEQIVSWNSDAVAPADPYKDQTPEYIYTFIAWNKPYTNVKENLDITAVYHRVKRQYTVTFLDDLGEVIGTSKVDYGTSAVEPISMKKTYVGLTWTWSDDFSNVTCDMTTTATFAKKVYRITVYIGDMYYTYERYYGEEFNPLEEIQLGGGNIVLTGNLKVRTSSGELSSEYYVEKYVVEDVDSVSFDAEYIIH